MTIDAIATIGAATGASAAPVRTVEPASSGFSQILETLNGLNTQMLANQQSVAAFALGRTDNLHEVMMNLERTRLDFELMLAVRNKLLESYQELMRMQV